MVVRRRCTDVLRFKVRNYAKTTSGNCCASLHILAETHAPALPVMVPVNSPRFPHHLHLRLPPLLQVPLPLLMPVLLQPPLVSGPQEQLLLRQAPLGYA